MNRRYAVGSAVIVAAFGVLVASSMRSNTLRAMPISKLRAADSQFVGQRLRVTGFVGQQAPRTVPVSTVDGTVDMHCFQVVDGKSTVEVNYRDALPDTFRLGGPVQVDGIYSAPGQMQADHVLTKCPSKYQSEQVYRRHQAEQGKSEQKS